MCYDRAGEMTVRADTLLVNQPGRLGGSVQRRAEVRLCACA